MEASIAKRRRVEEIEEGEETIPNVEEAIEGYLAECASLPGFPGRPLPLARLYRAALELSSFAVDIEGRRTPVLDPRDRDALFRLAHGEPTRENVCAVLSDAFRRQSFGRPLIEALPPELLAQVFSYLPPSGRALAPPVLGVSRGWRGLYGVAHAPQLRAFRTVLLGELEQRELDHAELIIQALRYAEGIGHETYQLPVLYLAEYPGGPAELEIESDETWPEGEEFVGPPEYRLFIRQPATGDEKIVSVQEGQRLLMEWQRAHPHGSMVVRPWAATVFDAEQHRIVGASAHPQWREVLCLPDTVQDARGLRRWLDMQRRMEEGLRLCRFGGHPATT